ncbi:2OG-Fe(II) oxygenase [Candidatus Woesearchaeota archaeon]|nr:2OG-Fe(II) oxygenase [Candidatus Woesearchaeota archaeon]
MFKYFEPSWKSLINYTNNPVLTDIQIDKVKNIAYELGMDEGRTGFSGMEKTEEEKKWEKKNVRNSKISFIPFEKMPEIYESIYNGVNFVNKEHMGFKDLQLQELGQYTEYGLNNFYDYHTDFNFLKANPGTSLVRKISVSILLSDPSEFEGGELELLLGKDPMVFSLKKGHALTFASFILHRVRPITKGIRRSLVLWFGGPSFE